MKIALLTAKPNKNKKMGNHVFNTSEKRPPHGIGFLFSTLKKAGYSTEIYDYYCGYSVWPKDDFASYDFVGIYYPTICNNNILTMIKKIKAKKLAVGGPHAFLYPNKIPLKVDYIVRGEAEHIICDLIENKITDRIVTTERLTNNDLDNIPRLPFRYFFNKHKRLYHWNFRFSKVVPIFTMNTSRGCPFNCSFCSVKKIWGRNYTAMSADRVIDDVQYIQSLGGKGVYFREDNFTLNKKRVQDFCGGLLRKNIKIVWACETRVDTIDDKLMALMRRAGCIGFYVGVEHLSQRMLDIYKKGITVEQIIKFFKSTYKYKIYTDASFIINHPLETEKDRLEQNKIMKIINPSRKIKNVFRLEG